MGVYRFLISARWVAGFLGCLVVVAVMLGLASWQLDRQESKRAVNDAGFKTPVVATGGISTFEQAEAILQKGQADIAGLARQALADPDWFIKVKLGRGKEVRRCTYTNYCEALDQAHRPVTCKLWDRVELDEPGIATVDVGRRRLLAPEWER